MLARLIAALSLAMCLAIVGCAIGATPSAHAQGSGLDPNGAP